MSRCVPSQTPFPIPDDELLLLDNQLCFPLYSAANAVVRAYRPLLDALDLTYPQYLVMMVLWQQNAISVKTLGEKLHLDSGTLTPLLKRLESKGLVERRRSVTDERARELWLTERGTALREQALAVPKSMVCKFDLDLDELVMLKQLCEKVVGKLNG
ncbi:MarR family transcriptional regulator [Vibrio sp. Vb2880]|uniref:MarR family transcriptional regulator n=2 Tax=Vibrionaceae TaxID=641 RepID=A0A0Q2RVV2_VIBFU|nr:MULTISPECIES: MarR family transcriptional regulator [Vibrio]KQH88182.1 MarR family transcriptional regulator [Vibrio furnissii]MBO0213411.1 MarR family transcriptional regulator [Vibrio sp. Vb2880]UON50293.1 MarR family transcriptional regulator [Vibrio furnissii]WHR53046.1 MarR family transcriptional regulator [Vibrio furnissii]WJG24519.1 MarR family transcriptional regulator [Vibrio furnissii]